MKLKKTARGFALREFVDANGVECRIQKSSSAEEDRIWLGASKLRVQEFVAFRQPAWEDVKFEQTMEHHFVGNEAMHLNRKQVKKLLPILQKFVETGEI